MYNLSQLFNEQELIDLNVFKSDLYSEGLSDIYLNKLTEIDLLLSDKRINEEEIKFLNQRKQIILDHLKNYKLVEESHEIEQEEEIIFNEPKRIYLGDKFKDKLFIETECENCKKELKISVKIGNVGDYEGGRIIYLKGSKLCDCGCEIIYNENVLSLSASLNVYEE